MKKTNNSPDSPGPKRVEAQKPEAATIASRSRRRAIDILRAEGKTIETFYSKALGRRVTIPQE